MILAIDVPKFNAAGLNFQRVDGAGEFRLIVDGVTKPDALARVQITDGQLQFYPMRSASQRQVLSLLGELVSSIQ